MKTTPTRRVLLGLAPLVALPVALAAAPADASAPPTSPPAEPTESVPPEDGQTLPGQAQPDAPLPATPLPEGFVELVDDTGLITVVVPETWADVDTAPTSNDDGSPRPYIAAAPDIAQFQETFDVPGVAYAAFPFAPDPQVLIDEFTLSSGCQSIEVEPYNDGVFTGVVQVGTSCGADGEATWNMIAASPADSSFTALVQLQTATAADEEAFDTVLNTFNYTVPNDTGAGSSVPGSSVPGSVPGSVPADNTPVAVAQAYATAVKADDAAAACALLGPTVLAEIAENDGTCEEQFIAGNDHDDPTVQSMDVVGEATADSGVCEPATDEGTAVVEIVGDDDAACVTLADIDGRWLIEAFEEV